MLFENPVQLPSLIAAFKVQTVHFCRKLIVLMMSSMYYKEIANLSLYKSEKNVKLVCYLKTLLYQKMMNKNLLVSNMQMQFYVFLS